jgi:hypothetical protein
MTLLPYRDHTYFLLLSTRTGETLLEAKMLCGSIIVWGSHYRPAEFESRLTDDGQTVALVGTLRDRIGPVVTFGEHLDVRASYSVEVGELPADYDPPWSRDST